MVITWLTGSTLGRTSNFRISDENMVGIVGQVASCWIELLIHERSGRFQLAMNYKILGTGFYEGDMERSFGRPQKRTCEGAVHRVKGERNSIRRKKEFRWWPEGHTYLGRRRRDVGRDCGLSCHCGSLLSAKLRHLCLKMLLNSVPFWYSHPAEAQPTGEADRNGNEVGPSYSLRFFLFVKKFDLKT